MDPLSQESRDHAAYKVCQDNYGRAIRRYEYGNNVDSNGNNPARNVAENHDSLEERLENAREVRNWATDEANRRVAWNLNYRGGMHEGVQQQVNLRRQDVTFNWSPIIEELEDLIRQANEADAHAQDQADDHLQNEAGTHAQGGSLAPLSNNEDSSLSHYDEIGAEHDKNIRDGREFREQRHVYVQHNDDEDEATDGNDTSYDDYNEYDNDSQYL